MLRRWWAPSPDPELPAIPTRRAYTEALGVFAAFFAAGIVGAALLLGGHSHDLTDRGSWGVYMSEVVDLICQIGLAVTVVILLAGRRGVTRADLGLRVPRNADGSFAVSLTVRLCGWSVFALIAGGVLNAVLQSGHLPTDQTSGPELVFGVVDSLQAGIVEELVVLAFVVVTLRQARRPLWEVVAVALVLRGSYHIYYGPGVFGIVLWAALYLWLYLRLRQLLPLMLCHFVWDAVGFLGERWHAVTGFALLVVVSVWIACLILWLAERSDRRRAAVMPATPWALRGPNYAAGGWPPQIPGSATTSRGAAPGEVALTEAAPSPVHETRPHMVPPPGWHPDPAGSPRWRWWDGQRWTDYLSP